MRITSWKRWTGTTSAALAAVAATTLAVAAVPASSASAATTVLPCTTRTTTKPFTQWGDGNSYFTLPGGTFESSPTSSGWTLAGGAAITAGNEPYKVISGTNASSLRMPAGATVTAPSFCVQPNEAAARFFYKSPGVPNSNLVLTMQTVKGTSTTVSYLWLDGSKPGWQVSPAVTLPDVGQVGVEAAVTISFAQKNATAVWLIDDFEVDPWRTM